MERQFRRIAIVNRGEPAMRLIRAVEELNREREAELRSIALFTDPDRKALFVREADEACHLGSAIFLDDRDGTRKSRYLDYGTLERVLRETRADAVWVGWGFVAEHAEFATLCGDLGIVFIGPDPKVMRKLGDKIESKRLAEQAGVPVAPWSGGPVETLAEARHHAEHLGFPLMIKATAGGGGRGIRRVLSFAELAEAFESARSEALKGFGDATVFLERLLEGARHIEVQIVGDPAGHVWALGVRDCSLQRRNQKVLEESPSPALSAAQHEEICAAAQRLGELAGYRNAGTVEFLYDPQEATFSFMEVNARLQVEHPVTEMTTGVDLVKLQIHVAQGGRLEGAPPAPRGHAIEVRVNAEDPERAFAPAPGEVVLFQQSGGPGIRIDTGFVEGDRIAPEFDSMIAKVIAHGASRSEALARLRRALLEMRLAIRGGASNKGFLIGLLDHPEVHQSRYDIGWLDRLARQDLHLTRPHADAAVLQAAVEAYLAESSVEQAQFYATAARGRLRLRQEIGHEVELRHHGNTYRARVHRVGPGDFRIAIDDVHVDVSVEQIGRFEKLLRFGDQRFQVLSWIDGRDHVVEVNGMPHRLSRDDAGTVRAPAPAVVLALEVKPGQRIRRGDRLVVLEAMKTEMPVLAPCDGRVGEILVTLNVQVDTGATLLLLEPLQDGHDESSTERIRFEPHAPEAPEETSDLDRCRRNLEQMRRLLLGFDVDQIESERLVEEHRTLCATASSDSAEVLREEDEILRIFADICALFSSRGEEENAAETEARTPEEYLLLYLRSLDTKKAGVSPAFVDCLRHSLSHYGIDSLARTEHLREALLWICKAHQRMRTHARIVLSILERRLDQIDLLAPQSGDEFRLLLDRIVPVTRRRHPGVSDLAQEVRYRYFYRPFFAEVWEKTYRTVETQLETLAGSPNAEARARVVNELVDCPQPLVGRFVNRFTHVETPLREHMLEILTRRHYRSRDLERLSNGTRNGLSFTQAEYEQDGQRRSVVTACSGWSDLEQTIRTLDALLSEVPHAGDLLIDVYLSGEPEALEEDRLEEELRFALERGGLSHPIRRLVVTVARPERAASTRASTYCFTFRQSQEDGFVEERLYRGLHPLIGERLELWRLKNFEIKRLPSTEGVYLIHAVARSNPKDERLFAFAEVRDLTPIHDASGRVTRLPHLEMIVMETLAAIRLFQSHRSARARLHWNRVFLYVWPPIEFGAVAMNEAAQRLAPVIEDLGLEKVVVRGRIRDAAGELHDKVIQVLTPGGREVTLIVTEPASEPVKPLTEYARKVVRMRQRGLLYPYEVIRTLTPPRDGASAVFPAGQFVEYDLTDEGTLSPIDRPPGGNSAAVVTGLIQNFTTKHPEGMRRVLLMGDPSRGMGSLAEPECRRIIAALDLAERESLPLEWFSISAGALIAMDSGTENLDWTAAVLRRIVEFTQAGGEINLVVAGVNVGAQSYWNAEATMLMHTCGILVMTAGGSMLLTGKRALDYSGAVSAEDNAGIGGYEKIMGVNGQAQYWAQDIWEACHTLVRYYEHAYVAPGERFPRRATTSDAFERDVCSYPHGVQSGFGFDMVGDIFADEKNPGRHRPFDIRTVMQAVVDQDLTPMERWRDLREGETAVTWEAHLGGHPVVLLGIESHPLPRLGFVPTDGPDQWSAGTLFPLSSKKIARAINAASGRRPVVVIANLSGFDGSPESMRRLQLEYGAEIGRAVVNFRGPLVFCSVSRFHGGAYVVFSRRLNEGLEVVALEGSYASVIGGKAAAAVVFRAEVDRRTRADPRLEELEREIAGADEVRRGRLRAQWHEVYDLVSSEKLGEVAEEFDSVHTVERAKRVGSLHQSVPPKRLRPFLIEAVERGIERELKRPPPPPGSRSGGQSSST